MSSPQSLVYLVSLVSVFFSLPTELWDKSFPFLILKTSKLVFCPYSRFLSITIKNTLYPRRLIYPLSLIPPRWFFGPRRSKSVARAFQYVCQYFTLDTVDYMTCIWSSNPNSLQCLNHMARHDIVNNRYSTVNDMPQTASDTEIFDSVWLFPLSQDHGAERSGLSL